MQAGLPLASRSTSYVALAAVADEAETVGNSVVVREPVGVVAAITPWNYPLHQAIAKVAPALLAGCTVVHKPSEVAPLSARILAEIADDVGLPAGVYNLVSGTGAVVGEALAQHPDVDMVSFTGSTRAGRRVQRAGLRHGQTGGAGARRQVRQRHPRRRGHHRRGQGRCRQLLPQLRADVHRMDPRCWPRRRATTRSCRWPHRPPRRTPSVTRQTQRRASVRWPTPHSASGCSATSPRALRTARGWLPAEPTRQASPTAGTTSPRRCSPMSPRTPTIAQEEIFGPVLSIIRFADEDDAVRIANGTQYGLAGAVWSADPEHAVALARRLRTGQVDINGGAFQPQRSVRRLQAVRERPRAGPARARGVPARQVAAAAVTVRAAVLREVGAPLHVEEIRLPHPGPGQVRVRMVATGVLPLRPLVGARDPGAAGARGARP